MIDAGICRDNLGAAADLTACGGSLREGRRDGGTEGRRQGGREGGREAGRQLRQAGRVAEMRQVSLSVAVDFTPLVECEWIDRSTRIEFAAFHKRDRVDRMR